jgi:hypothetical protein
MQIYRTLFYLLLIPALLTSSAFAQTGAEQAESVDWFYILRGFVFIFASALGAVWLGRRIVRNRK